MQVAGFAFNPLDISDFPTRHNYGLALWQESIERILAARVDELRIPIHRGREVTGFAQDDTGVDVEVGGGRSLRAQYLVGCDGGRSLIRKKAGIDFPGWDPSVSYLIAEVDIHGASPEFVRELKSLGYEGLPVETLVKMRIHGVTPDFIRRVARRADAPVSTETLVKMRIHGEEP